MARQDHSEREIALLKHEMLLLKEQVKNSTETAKQTLEALGKESQNHFFEQCVSSILGLAPSGYIAHPQSEITSDYLKLLLAEIRKAFHDVPNIQFMSPAYIRYRQIEQFPIRESSLLVISSQHESYEDAKVVTGCKRLTQIRLNSLHGPLQVVGDDNRVEIHPLNIEEVFSLNRTFDYLWIPSPSLASLFLRCRSLIYRAATHLNAGMVFGLFVTPGAASHGSQTRVWSDKAVRHLLHANGFVEAGVVAGEENSAYVSHHHEMYGFYPKPAEAGQAEKTPRFCCYLALKQKTHASST